MREGFRPVPDLTLKKSHPRNITGSLLTTLAGLFALTAVLPLVLVLGYVLYKGASKLSFDLFFR